MARRRSSNSNNGGCLGAFLLIGLVVYLFENYWPVLLVVAGIAFIIWAISKAAQNRNANNTSIPSSSPETSSLNINTPTRAASVSTTTQSHNPPPVPVVSQYSGTDPNICHEINRQITEMLNRRRELSARIESTQKSIWKLNKSIGGLNQDKAQKRDALIQQKELLNGRLNAAVYTFSESESKSLTELKAAFADLRGSDAKPYNGTPASRTLTTAYIPVGDMKYILFAAEPLCLTLGGDIFCVLPSYIVRFKKDGTYITTYTCKALNARVENGLYSEEVTQYRWLYARQDGGPDLRYRNNRQISYQTTRNHTIPNMLFLELAGATLQYDVAYGIRNKLAAAIKVYTAVEPSKSYDLIHHVVRLLDACEPNNPNVRKLQNILSGDDNYIEYNDDASDSTASTLYQSVRQEANQPSEEPEQSSKAKRFIKGFIAVTAIGAAVIAGVNYGPAVIEHLQGRDNVSEQTIELPDIYSTRVPVAKPVHTIEPASSVEIALPTVAPTAALSTTGVPAEQRLADLPTQGTYLSSIGGKHADALEVFDLLDFGMTQEEIITIVGSNYKEQYRGEPSYRNGKYEQSTNYMLTFGEDYYLSDYCGKIRLKVRVDKTTGVRYLIEKKWDYDIQGPITNEADTLISILNSRFGDSNSDKTSDGTSSGKPIAEGDPYFRTIRWENRELFCHYGRENSSLTYYEKPDSTARVMDEATASSLEPTEAPTEAPTQEPIPEAINASSLTGMPGFEYAQGSRGDATRYIQQMLIDQGYLAAGQADGVYGPKTETAVKTFQEANGLAVTGIVDLATQFKLAELESGFSKIEGHSYEYAGLNRYGVYRFDEGVFIGIVKADQSYQEGTLYYKDGTTYVGAFKNNQRSGKGEAWYPNGDYYTGNWQNDKMNGKGVYHFGSVDSTEQYDGEWVDGKMSGKGIYTLADGTTIKGIWENNEQVGWWK